MDVVMIKCLILFQTSFPWDGWMGHRHGLPLMAHHSGSRRLNHAQNTQFHPQYERPVDVLKGLPTVWYFWTAVFFCRKIKAFRDF